MKTLAYLMYGQKRAYGLELTYSVASVVRFMRAAPADIRVLLITDEDGVRRDLPVDHLIFSAGQFAEWTQGGSYNHAAKVHALIMAMDQSSGPVALIDTDTYFTQHPAALFERIGPGLAVMQAKDQAIGELDFWQQLLKKSSGEVSGYRVAHDSPMNNSGVIGVDQRDKAIIPEIISLLEKLYAISPVFNIEQFAVTSVLARHTNLSVAPDIVHHYWPFHERVFIHAELDRVLPIFDATNFEKLVASFRLFGMPAKRLGDQLLARIRGAILGWSPEYRFAYLAGLSACSSRDPYHANAWAAVAADFLAKGEYSKKILQRDFRPLVGDRQSWMTLETARIWKGLLGVSD